MLCRTGLMVLAVCAAIGLADRCALAQRLVQSAVFQERSGPVQRCWVEYRPSGVPAEEPLPTVFVLHPGASTPENVANNSRWDLVADEHRLMIIYPGATPGAMPSTGVWNAWDWDDAPTPPGTPAGLAARDDIGFLVLLVDLVSTRASRRADPARRYMTGFSSGSQMALTFAGAGRTEIAAYAPVSGGWCEPYGVPDEFCRPAAPVPVWIWRGRGEDGLSPGGVSRLIHDQMQRDFWLTFNGADPVPDVTESRQVTGVRVVQGNANTVTVTHNTSIYTDGLAEVRYTEVVEGTHEYQVGAAPRIWSEFFSRFRVPACAADFDRSGGVSVEDLFAFLAAYFSNQQRADVNGSGSLTIQDIFDFLVAYFEGCG